MTLPASLRDSLSAREHLLYCTYCKSYFCTWPWYNVHVILYHALWLLCKLYSLCWNVYTLCTSILWFWYVLMLNIYTRGYFCPAYIRRSSVFVSVRAGRYTLSSMGGSRCLKRIFQRVFKCLIHGLESDWINSSDFKVSSPSSSKWLFDTMFTERDLKISSTLTSESYDDVADELSW